MTTKKKVGILGRTRIHFSPIRIDIKMIRIHNTGRYTMAEILCFPLPLGAPVKSDDLKSPRGSPVKTEGMTSIWGKNVSSFDLSDDYVNDYLKVRIYLLNDG